MWSRGLLARGLATIGIEVRCLCKMCVRVT
jgi:hypothetical protein